MAEPQSTATPERDVEINAKRPEMHPTRIDARGTTTQARALRAGGPERSRAMPQVKPGTWRAVPTAKPETLRAVPATKPGSVKTDEPDDRRARSPRINGTGGRRPLRRHLRGVGKRRGRKSWLLKILGESFWEKRIGPLETAQATVRRLRHPGAGAREQRRRHVT
jgi:hypothetical protein